MKKLLRKGISLVLTALLMLSLTVPVSAAENDGYEFGTLGQKTAQPLVNPGQYEITVSVPGAVETEEYSEIIVMVDASDSQSGNLTKLKTMLVSLAEQVLHNDGSTRLTLMGYGMGPTRAGSFYNAETLAAYLETMTQQDLMQGVSATNCERALDYVREYIEQSEKLHKTFVIFTSDGNTNMDETPYSLSEWVSHPEWYMNGAAVQDVIAYAAGGQAELLVTSGTILSPTAALYPEESINLALLAHTEGLGSAAYIAAVDDLYSKITASEAAGIAYVNAVWADVFANSGMTYGASGLYSTSRMEKAFLDYYDGVFTNSFLVSIHRRDRAGCYPDYYNLSTWGSRSSIAADKLAANEKVLELYMMDFSAKNNTWMNPNSTTAHHCTSSKISYNTASSFSAALDKIEDLSSEMFVTVYSNATVVDPMSKWVTLDPSSIRIYEDDLLIYRYGEGWLYEDKQPAADPIALTVNEDGRYQITWRIKDGNLLYTDRYFLKYIVDTDETAEGFQYDTLYPANDPTHVEYTDANGEEQRSSIPVPDVKELTPSDDFADGDKGLQIYKGSSIDGSPISEIKFDVYHVVPSEGEILSPNPTSEEYSKYMSDETFVGSIVTDALGYGAMNLTQLGYDDGFYLIVEQASSKVKAPLSPFYISIPMLDPQTGAPMDIVKMYPKNEPVVPNTPIEPDIPEEPETPETGKITVLKHSEADESIVLAGAQFQVYRLALAQETPTMTVSYNGQDVGLVPMTVNDQTVTITTGENGLGASRELPLGLYFLVETKSPNGYNLMDEPIAVFVTPTSHETANAVKIANTAGVHLPETGGIGTAVFTVSGLLLMALAASLLVLKKRRSF
ncbi:MAG: LPXTG cell wall anchor domain-containing protein [Ruminococcaceae bacterium]|nr:LPXTG cell wall anchor domain-containing protein [Oscillospiraceae bacterium]